MQIVRSLIAVAALTPMLHAQRAERFTLSGERTAIYNVAGEVRVERGTGRDVVVEVTRGGSDANRISIEERTVNGRTALCITFPDERIVYRPDGNRWNGNTNSSSGDPCQERGRSWLGGRRIEVSSRGSGVEAWADVVVRVPAGNDVLVHHMVGRVDVDGVDATLVVDVAAARITSRGTRGDLLLDSGSGSITVNGHRGELSVDVGSGSITIDDVESRTITLDTGSGGVQGSRVQTTDLNVDTGSGGIDLRDVTARTARFDAGSGQVSLDFTARIDDLSIDTGSGGVILTMPANYGAQVDISTGSGGITTDFDVSTRRLSQQQLRGTIGDGRGRLQVETGSGGVRLSRR